jgi:hypothetical protein
MVYNRISGFLSLVYHQEFGMTRKHNIWEIESILHSVSWQHTSVGS